MHPPPLAKLNLFKAHTAVSLLFNQIQVKVMVEMFQRAKRRRIDGTRRTKSAHARDHPTRVLCHIPREGGAHDR